MHKYAIKNISSSYTDVSHTG